jgi:3-oxoacyl-[acyl-carrier protein] reductase
MSESESKVALVTGATRGIGQAIAQALGLAGFTVIGTATTTEGAQQITAGLSELGIQGVGMVLQVADQASIDSAYEQIVAQWGEPLVLVNNAGITRDTLFLRMKDDDWNTVLDVNLSSAFRLSKVCIKAMTKARWGRIINVSSVIGSLGNAGQVNYSASKAGLEGFTRALAREVASRSITVNAVAPGFIETAMTEVLADAQKASILAQVPLSRLGTAEEVAAAVKFLASDDAAYITGQTMHVNGGMYMG